MEKLIQQVISIREKCKEYQDNLDKKSGDEIIQNDPRSGCFGMIFNGATVTLELLDHYYSIWSKRYTVTIAERNKIVGENAERCMKILRMLFIDSLSSIEYSIKNSILLYPNSELYRYAKKQQRKGKTISLRAIIQKSKSFIQNEYKYWDFILITRNCAVHNNSIADRNLEIDINGRKFKMEKGEMMRDKLDFFGFLTLILIDIYHIWINKIIDGN